MTLPSSVRSIFSAEGTFGRPGIVMMSPHTMTTNSAPAAKAHLAYIDDVAGRGAAQTGIRGEGILRLRDADGITAIAFILQTLDLAAHLRVRRDVARTVNAWSRSF